MEVSIYKVALLVLRWMYRSRMSAAIPQGLKRG